MAIRSNLEILTIKTAKREVIWQDEELIEAPNFFRENEFVVNGNGKMFKIDRISNQRIHIDTATVENCNNDHGLSPDGKMLFISSHDTDDNNPEAWKTSKVYQLPIQGGIPQLITPKDTSFWHGVSPDGQYIVYTAFRDREWNIFRNTLSGDDEQQLTFGPGHKDGSEYSPDGKYIYYNSYASGSMEIWRMTDQGKEHTQVTHDACSNWFPHVSPDGSSLVYLAYVKDQKEDHPFGHDVILRMIDINTQLINDISDVFYGGQGTINVNSWSPDGTQIAFMSYLNSI